MSIPSVINVDLADVFAQPGRKYFLHTLAWGDAVEVLEITDTDVKIATTKPCRVRIAHH